MSNTRPDFRAGGPPRHAAILLRTGCADLIEAADMLRQRPTRQAGYMHADRFDITNKKLAKGVGSIHAQKGRLPQIPPCPTTTSPSGSVWPEMHPIFGSARTLEHDSQSTSPGGSGCCSHSYVLPKGKDMRQIYP
ncbi:hypothetical protein E0W60_36315 (plasmid) [Cupriavidus oxalaticus]|uniref:Uncharacterized protein n=1 Tax=Cupriavidus oxalaticus TaxID=96344 RepID=A0A4P7LVF0_9BURK|nr:hypothetical protein E0W60_36315 [Cupriavidus oxalaticus]